MTSKIDIRIKYGAEFGYGIDYVNHLAENGDKHYTHWLEEKLTKSEFFNTLMSK